MRLDGFISSGERGHAHSGAAKSSTYIIHGADTFLLMWKSLDVRGGPLSGGGHVTCVDVFQPWIVVVERCTEWRNEDRGTRTGLVLTNQRTVPLQLQNTTAVDNWSSCYTLTHTLTHKRAWACSRIKTHKHKCKHARTYKHKNAHTQTHTCHCSIIHPDTNTKYTHKYTQARTLRHNFKDACTHKHKMDTRTQT